MALQLYILPKVLSDVLTKPEGFSIEEIVKTLDDHEVKTFLDNLKPVLMEMLKKEFPLLSIFS